MTMDTCYRTRRSAHHVRRARAPLRALIVDDEPLARRGLEIRLQAHPDVEIVGEYGDGLSALEGLREHRPDLIFLDVQMPGMDGFQTLRSIPTTEMPLVVFVTAYDHYAIRAFEASAAGLPAQAGGRSATGAGAGEACARHVRSAAPAATARTCSACSAN